MYRITKCTHEILMWEIDDLWRCIFGSHLLTFIWGSVPPQSGSLIINDGLFYSQPLSFIYICLWIIFRFVHINADVINSSAIKLSVAFTSHFLVHLRTWQNLILLNVCFECKEVEITLHYYSIISRNLYITTISSYYLICKK